MMTKFSSDVDAANALADAYKKLKAEISNIVIGQEEVVRQVLTGIFCQGHSLLVGVPGLAKRYFPTSSFRPPIAAGVNSSPESIEDRAIWSIVGTRGAAFDGPRLSPGRRIGWYLRMPKTTDTARFPWRELMAVGFGRLRLTSAAFWAMTPRELASAIEGLPECG